MGGIFAITISLLFWPLSLRAITLLSNIHVWRLRTDSSKHRPVLEVVLEEEDAAEDAVEGIAESIVEEHHIQVVEGEQR
jgi:Co/Zn/Cd efflux system component